MPSSEGKTGKSVESAGPFKDLVQEVNHPKAGRATAGHDAGLSAAARIAAHDAPRGQSNPTFVKGWDRERFKTDFVQQVLQAQSAQKPASEVAYGACVRALQFQNWGEYPHDENNYRNKQEILESARDAQKIAERCAPFLESLTERLKVEGLNLGEETIGRFVDPVIIAVDRLLNPSQYK